MTVISLSPYHQHPVITLSPVTHGELCFSKADLPLIVKYMKWKKYK